MPQTIGTPPPLNTDSWEVLSKTAITHTAIAVQQSENPQGHIDALCAAFGEVVKVCRVVAARQEPPASTQLLVRTHKHTNTRTHEHTYTLKHIQIHHTAITVDDLDSLGPRPGRMRRSECVRRAAPARRVARYGKDRIPGTDAERAPRAQALVRLYVLCLCLCSCVLVFVCVCVV